MPHENCPNCGVELSETPEEDGLHPVQMATPVEGGEVYCEACAFRAPDHGEYEHDGATIVRAAGVDMPDDELAEELAMNTKAEELRRFMSAYGMTRSRGARKLESARQAVEQDRTRVAATVARYVEDEGEHVATCGHCDYEERFHDEGAAEEAARSHKSENPTHFPRALANDEERIYG